MALTAPSFSQSSVVGDLLLVLNSLCYGTYIAISKRLLSRYNALTVITWIFIVGCIPTVPVAAFSLSRVSLGDVPGSVWLAVAYIVLFATVVCYYLNSWALARVPPSTVAVYIYLQPLIAFVLAPIVLGEKLNSRVIIASLLVFRGRGGRDESRPDESNRGSIGTSRRFRALAER